MEFLKEFLDETLYDALLLALKGKGRDGKDFGLLPNDGSFVPLGKFNELLQQKKQLEKEQPDKDELVRLREQVVCLEQAKREYIIEQQLADMQVKNAAAARALLELDEKCGDADVIRAAIVKLKEDNDFLFEQETPRFTGIVLSDGDGAGAAFNGLHDFAMLSEAQRLRLKQENSQGYRQAYAQHVKTVRKVL